MRRKALHLRLTGQEQTECVQGHEVAHFRDRVRICLPVFHSLDDVTLVVLSAKLAELVLSKSVLNTAALFGGQEARSVGLQTVSK